MSTYSAIAAILHITGKSSERRLLLAFTGAFGDTRRLIIYGRRMFRLSAQFAAFNRRTASRGEAFVRLVLGLRPAVNFWNASLFGERLLLILREGMPWSYVYLPLMLFSSISNSAVFSGHNAMSCFRGMSGNFDGVAWSRFECMYVFD